MTLIFDIKVLDELGNEAFDGEAISKILIDADKNKYVFYILNCKMI